MPVASETLSVTADQAARIEGLFKGHSRSIPDELAAELIGRFAGSKFVHLRQANAGSVAYNYTWDHSGKIAMFEVSLHWDELYWAVARGEVLIKD